MVRLGSIVCIFLLVENITVARFVEHARRFRGSSVIASGQMRILIENIFMPLDTSVEGRAKDVYFC